MSQSFDERVGFLSDLSAGSTLLLFRPSSASFTYNFFRYSLFDSLPSVMRKKSTTTTMTKRTNLMNPIVCCLWDTFDLLKHAVFIDFVFHFVAHAFGFIIGFQLCLLYLVS